MVLAACANVNVNPRPQPPPVVEPVRLPNAPAHPGRAGVLVGFVCPDGNEGRPLLVAAALRRETDWTAAPAELRKGLARVVVRELGVMGFAGRRSGQFTPLGPVDLHRPEATALGAFAGSAPCSDEATAAECQAATAGCGLASGIAELEEGPRPPSGTGCAAGDRLLVDIDGDGKNEAFPLADLRASLEEVGSLGAASGTCKPRYAGALSDGLDLLGVADLDLDGRIELAVGVRGPSGRTRASIYSAGSSPGRLDLLGVVNLP